MSKTEIIDPEVLVKFKGLIKKAVSLAEEGSFEKAIRLIGNSLKEAEKLTFIQPEVDLRNQLGILHWKNNSFDYFLEVTATSLALARAHNYKKGIAEALLNLAWVLAMERKD
ncbi:MAG: hypothetical protein ACW964_19760, partial [Candidatus Hodarchaeales archaeon]